MKQPPRSTLTFLALLAFLLGVVSGNFFPFPVGALALTSAIGIAGAVILRRHVPLLILGIILASGALGSLRFEFARPSFDAQTLASYNDREEKITLLGVVAEDPDRRADHTKLILEAQILKTICSAKLPATKQLDCDRERSVHGRVLMKIPKLPEYDYGDELRISGQLQTPFETDEFSYRDYLARYEIYSVMYYPRVERIQTGLGNPLFATLYRVKRIVENKINQIFPEPSASFAAGLLTGSRRGIPDDVLADFNTTGLTHIIAISGYNIALVIALITALIGTRVPRRWQFPLVMIFVILFTLFVGAGAAVVRAAIMGLLSFFALTHGRQTNVKLLLLFTAVVMVAWNPRILLSDVSFQLSFSAVAGLLYLSPHLEKWTAKIPNVLAIRESLVLTLSANVATLPLILFYFGRVSLIAPLANLLVAPAIPLAMLLGALATFIGFISLSAGMLVGSLAYVVLNYILLVAEKLAALPFANL